jgi:hypothetical protein
VLLLQRITPELQLHYADSEVNHKKNKKIKADSLLAQAFWQKIWFTTTKKVRK